MAIDFPTSPVVGQTYSSSTKTWYWTGSAWKLSIIKQDIIPIDNVANQFDGKVNRFPLVYQGAELTVNNPFRLMVTVNGILQPVYTSNYIWDPLFSPDGFFVDSDGYIAFSEVIPPGSTFSGRLMNGSETTTSSTIYPFRPLDILLGGYN
jgi:hypothetical protein